MHFICCFSECILSPTQRGQWLSITYRLGFNFTEWLSLHPTRIPVLLQLWHLLTYYFPSTLSQLFSVFLSLFLFHAIPSASCISTFMKTIGASRYLTFSLGDFCDPSWKPPLLCVCVRGGMEDASPPLPTFLLRSQRKDFLPLPLVHSGSVEKLFLLPFYHFLLEEHWAWQFFIV